MSDSAGTDRHPLRRGLVTWFIPLPTSGPPDCSAAEDLLRGIASKLSPMYSPPSIGSALMGVALMGVALIGVALMGIVFMSAAFKGLVLIGFALIGLAPRRGGGNGGGCSLSSPTPF